MFTKERCKEGIECDNQKEEHCYGNNLKGMSRELPPMASHHDRREVLLTRRYNPPEIACTQRDTQIQRDATEERTGFFLPFSEVNISGLGGQKARGKEQNQTASSSRLAIDSQRRVWASKMKSSGARAVHGFRKEIKRCSFSPLSLSLLSLSVWASKLKSFWA